MNRHDSFIVNRTFQNQMKGNDLVRRIIYSHLVRDELQLSQQAECARTEKNEKNRSAY